jgi:hypothetical protein
MRDGVKILLMSQNSKNIFFRYCHDAYVVINNKQERISIYLLKLNYFIAELCHRLTTGDKLPKVAISSDGGVFIVGWEMARCQRCLD